MEVSEIQKLVIYQLKSYFMISKQEEYLLEEEMIYNAVFNTQRCLANMSNKYYDLQNQKGGVLHYIIQL